ncbi:MAG: dual specificity protein phosphatase family protein [Candidatus Aenigmarchaeota archaeon]|nr:dual specificity protein phosphatase family protein [Candidatus Aenigmarchaeota archaeon]
MFWYQDNLGTCGQAESRIIRHLKDKSIEIIIVYDLIDSYQENWGQFVSKVNRVEKALKQGKKVVVACRGGMSRSNAVVLAYLLKSDMDWNEAYNIIRKNPMSMIEPNLLRQIKEKMKVSV